jgi:phosphotransferase system enzyme I (PtsI)
MLKGRKGSPGIGVGEVLIINNKPIRVEKKITESPDLQIKRLLSSLSLSKIQLTKIRDQSLETLGEKKAFIFDSHIMLSEDPEVIEQTKELIKEQKLSAEYAYQTIIDQFISLFENMDDDYLRGRALDIKDISQRVLKNLLGVPIHNLSGLEKEYILVAPDMTPSETATVNPQKVLGFLTDIGGRTSHSAIIARTLEIPAVVGLGNITSRVKTGDIIAMDGDTGEVYINPTSSIISHFNQKKENLKNHKKELLKYKSLKTVTKEGQTIELVGNIRSPEDLDLLEKYGAEGVGLFRTEFIFMGRSEAPNEQEQFEIYKKVLSRLSPRPVVVRTLDIGGDKQIPYLNMEKEENPFLGVRAIRLCLTKKELFKTQIKALLRAGIHGNLKVMLPMISSLEELLKAKEIFSECEQELEKKGVSYTSEYEFGIMIEIPSAAIISDILANHVDFMSIGTNDLIQYTCAVDRMNQNLAPLYTPFNPAVLRLIQMVIKNGQEKGCWVGMCGEAASQKELIPLWVGMGIDELSVTPSSILQVRKVIHNLSQKDSISFLDQTLLLPTAKEIETFLS